MYAPQRSHGFLPRERRADLGGARRARLRRAALGPPFIDGTGYVKTLATRSLAFETNGTNTADGWDILGIVVELDVATMLRRAPGTLFAAAAETVAAGKFPVRVERFGRVFVKNQLLGEYGVDMVNRDVDLREFYNQEDPFQLGRTTLASTAPGRTPTRPSWMASMERSTGHCGRMGASH